VTKKSALDTLLTPRVVLPVLILILILAAVFSPGAVDRAERLTTHSVAGRGALGFFESALRMGYRASRMEAAYSDTMRRNITWVVLSPTVRLTGRDASRLLNAVREGASLLYVGRGGSVLDSLGVVFRRVAIGFTDSTAGVFATISGEHPGCRPPAVEVPTGLAVPSITFRLRDSAARETTTFVVARGVRNRQLIAAGMKVGKGRVLLVTQPSMFRNDVLRSCHRKEGILAFRMLEWLTDTLGNELVFDEYHHGYGVHERPMGVVRRGVVGSPAGRALLQVVAASLVLLAVAGVRPIPPQQRERIERRSPFEHVGALARAYENVRATRRATRLFVHGLRRRHDAAAWRMGGDEDYLRAVRASHPSLAPHVDLVLQALRNPPTPAQFIEVGKAVEHIERTLSRAYS
jgi:hypothetical protein